jgi:choline kinase
MRAIILAAGRGRRLEASGWTAPKCLLPVGSTTILDNMLDALAKHGVRDLVMVVGYRQEDIRRHMAARGLQPAYVENPEFSDTNTINSLWRTREFMDADFLYFNADVLFHGDVLGRLLAEPGSRLAVDRKKCGDEEVKVVLDPGGRVRRIGKALDPALCAGEFIGIAQFARRDNAAFVEALRRRNIERGEVKLFFEAAVDDLLDEHAMQAVDVSDLASIEVDFPEDWKAAQALAARATAPSEAGRAGGTQG